MGKPRMVQVEPLDSFAGLADGSYVLGEIRETDAAAAKRLEKAGKVRIIRPKRSPTPGREVRRPAREGVPNSPAVPPPPAGAAGGDPIE